MKIYCLILPHLTLIYMSSGYSLRIKRTKQILNEGEHRGSVTRNDEKKSRLVFVLFRDFPSD